MRHYVIETKCSTYGGGGLPCGFYPSSVLAMVRYKDEDGKEGYLYCDEFDGIPSFYTSEGDYFDALIQEESEGDIREEKLSLISAFEGIELGEYEHIFNRINQNRDSKSANLFRYLILLVRCNWENLENYRTLGTNKWIEDIVVPPCDIEEDMAEEQD